MRLPEDGEIHQLVKYLIKATAKVLNKLYADYEDRSLENDNQFLTDIAISWFADILGGLDAIESSEALNKEL